MMNCEVCKKRIRQDEKVIPVCQVIENERRGDFVSSPVAHVHLRCLRVAP